jgi:hypothetical protein
MELSLVFADSEVASVESEANAVCIRLSAAHVLRQPLSGEGKADEGFARGVVLLLKGASLNAAEGHFVGSLEQSRVRIGDAWSSTLALPSSALCDVSLELTFANQSLLVLAASGIECRFEGEPNFAESLFC